MSTNKEPVDLAKKLRVQAAVPSLYLILDKGAGIGISEALTCANCCRRLSTNNSGPVAILPIGDNNKLLSAPDVVVVSTSCVTLLTVPVIVALPSLASIKKCVLSFSLVARSTLVTKFFHFLCRLFNRFLERKVFTSCCVLTTPAVGFGATFCFLAGG